MPTLFRFQIDMRRNIFEMVIAAIVTFIASILLNLGKQ